MRQLLTAMAADLAVRTEELLAYTKTNTEPDLAEMCDIVALECESVLKDLSVLPAAADVPAGGEGVQLRRLRRMSLGIDGAEWPIRAARKNYGAEDRKATAVLRALLREAGWTEWTPTVQTWSDDYFWAVRWLRIVGVPAGEQDRILRLPDWCHEFGHCLYVAHKKTLTASVIADLLLWSRSGPAVNRIFRNDVYALWHGAWLEELTCDAVGTFLTGPAYAWQHLTLAARRSGGDPYATTESHPADHARAILIRAMLERTGFASEAANFEADWRTLCHAYEQPVPLAEQKDLGSAATKDPDFWARYPVDSRGRMIERVADLTASGMASLGFQSCPRGRGTDAGIRALIQHSWTEYHRDPSGFAAAEPGLVGKLHALC